MSKQQNNTGGIYDVKLLKRMLKQVRPYNKTFGLTIFLGLLLSIVSPLKPLLIMNIIEDNILSDVGWGLLTMVCIYFGILLFESIMQYSYGYLSKFVAQSVIKDMRTQVFNHISKLKLQFFNKTPIGKLTTRTINDIEALNRTFSDGFTNIIQDVLKIVFIIVIMFIKNWQLALLVLVPFPMIIIATYIFKEKVKASFKRVRSSVQELNTYMQEHISGMKIVQMFAVEDKTSKEFNIINHKNKKANIDAVLYYAIYYPVLEILTASSLALLIWYGCTKIGLDKSYVAEITGFYLWSVMLFRPLRMLADRFNTLQMGMVASERVFELLDTDIAFQTNGLFAPNKLDGHIQFENVWFAYDDENWVIKDLSFDLKRGETLALVGSTGSGKSTTINLVNRFYDIQRGKISIDGLSVTEFDLEAMRGRIATVQQDVFLFSGSIYENIVMNNKSISKEEVIIAAKEVGVHDFIMSLPGGYDYEVMERGSTLSSGQRQLISFIRAMVAKPDILILDEATASIDTETEVLLQHATEKLMIGRTSIVIAHRLSTIQNATKIAVLEHGNLIEIGNHEELIRKGGAYRRLHDMQFQKELVN